MAADPLWGNVVLAMHMNSLVDEKGKIITAGGNAAISAAQSKFDGYSCFFDGTGDYLSPPNHSDFTFGTGEFCIEAHVYPTSVASGACTIFGVGVNGATFISVKLDANRKLVLRYNGNDVYTSSNAVALNAWSHIALARVVNVFTFYVDGTASTNTYTNAGLNVTGTIAAIGAEPAYKDATTTSKFTGYIDELKVTKGAGRYTTNFTAPTSQFLEAGQISGSVLNAAGAAIAGAAIRVYLDSDGSLLRTAVTDGSGNFTVNCNTTNYHDVVCDFGTSENKQIWSRMTPG
jgi:hypothetical protein